MEIDLKNLAPDVKKLSDMKEVVYDKERRLKNRRLDV